MANADATSEQALTSNMGGCYRPTFAHAGDRLFFLHEEWPHGPTGVAKFSVWEINIDGSSVRMLADHGLFDAPLSWTPQITP